MDPAWPKRIDCGHGEVTFRKGRQAGFSTAESGNVLGQARRPMKMFVLASMPAFPPTIHRPFLCRAAPCASMLPVVDGLWLCKSESLAPAQPSDKLVRNCWTPLAAARSMWCWFDRWGRSVTDLLATLQELEHLGVGFVSLTEALDLPTPAGRTMAGLPAIFAGNAERAIMQSKTVEWAADLAFLGGFTAHNIAACRSGIPTSVLLANRPISAQGQGVLSLRASATILVRRLESRSRQARVSPPGRVRRNISSRC